MPRSPRLLACFAMLIAAVVVAAGDASGAARDAGLADATRPRTITVTPLRIGELAAGRRRLAWGDVFQGIQIFDRVTHRVTTLARRLCSDSTAMTGPVLAGKRVVFTCDVGGNSDVGATVFTAALDDRRVRLLRSWEVSWQAGDVGELYGYPSGSSAVEQGPSSTASTAPGSARMPVSGVLLDGGRSASPTSPGS